MAAWDTYKNSDGVGCNPVEVMKAAKARIAQLEATLAGAVADVAAERERQKAVEGWTPEHDDGHANGEMAAAARAYLQHVAHYTGATSFGYVASEPPSFWPWDRKWWKPKNERRDLVRAAALIVAEIERIDRLTKSAAA